MPRKTKEQIAEYHKVWWEKNIVAQKTYAKAYYKKTKDKKKEYYKANLPAIKSYKLRGKYGITLDDYNEMFIKQDGKCAICGNHQSEIKTTLVVDHCHSTGKIRGLLCGNCNRGIGMLNHDIENLRCAILYLNKRN